MAGSIIKDLQNYSCPLCLEIFEDPVNLPCKHCFCRCCIQSFGQKFCPVCRKEFALSSIKSHEDLNSLLQELVALCAGCKDEVVLNGLRNHNASCLILTQMEQKNLQMIKILPEKTLAKENRFTFMCPYCNLDHLDHALLIDHCNELHAFERSPVVCPICMSMPWGDPKYLSGDFIAHLNARHKFEYDTFVDYDRSEEEMLRQAIQESLKEP